MEIVRADALGMCFGVRDAIAVTEAVDHPEDTAIHGELVHNETVRARLHERGFEESPEDARDVGSSRPVVLITAHGVSDRERRRLERAGKRLLDTTCPLVHRAHEAALRLARSGHFVVVIGRSDHVEVRGLVGDLDRYAIVGGPNDVRTWSEPVIGVISQTTAVASDVHATVEAIRAANPGAEIRFVDTVCQPTKDRQEALDRLVDRVDAVVVVGGRNSNNTRQLAAKCRAHGTPAFQVASASELDPVWFTGCEAVGITAGTSTLDDVVDAVEARLREFATHRSGALDGKSKSLDRSTRSR